ncbi:MAG: site-specific integrase, partial [Methyloceanibacter sp.]
MAAKGGSRDKGSSERGSSELAFFLDMLTAERGAARHTIDAYARDLSEFLAHLAAKGRTAADATSDHLRAYLAA